MNYVIEDFREYMNSNINDKNGKKRKKSNTQNTSGHTGEKPGKQNCNHDANVNINKAIDINREPFLIMNAVSSIPPNFNTPVFQQYQGLPNPNLNQSSPVHGYYNVPYTPQGPTVTPQPVFSPVLSHPNESIKIDNLTNKVEQLFNKLSILDSVSDKLNKFQSTMNTLVTNVDDVTKRVADMEQSISFLNDKYETSLKQSADIKSEIHEIKTSHSEVNMHVNRLSRELVELRERHIDLQTRSMRENLVFAGIPESNEDEQSDETGTIIKTFMTEKLKFEAPIEFVRAHRFGRKDKKPRPIVCRFKTFNDRETVRKSATNLKGTAFSINEQFPKEINDRRKELWPYYKEAKEQEKKAFFRRDKLIIDGRQFILHRRTDPDMEIDDRAMRARYEQQGARPKSQKYDDPDFEPIRYG